MPPVVPPPVVPGFMLILRASVPVFLAAPLVLAFAVVPYSRLLFHLDLLALSC